MNLLIYRFISGYITYALVRGIYFIAVFKVAWWWMDSLTADLHYPLSLVLTMRV